MNGIGTNLKTLLVLGILGAAGYYFYRQFSLLTSSLISLEGIRNISFSGGGVSIHPEIGIYNPSDFSISVNNLSVKAYTKQGTQWVLSGVTPVPVTAKIGAKEWSYVAPIISVPFAAIAAQTINTLLFRDKTKPQTFPLVKLDISATVANQPVSVSHIVDPNEFEA